MMFVCAGLIFVLCSFAWSLWCAMRHRGAWWFVIAPPLLSGVFVALGVLATLAATVRGLSSGTQRNIAAEETAAAGNIMLALAALMLLASVVTNVVASVRTPVRGGSTDRRA